MKEQIIQHIHIALTEATRFNDPFDLVCFKPFPDEVYHKLLAYFPDKQYFIANDHLDSFEKRRSLTLRKNRLEPLPSDQRQFWTEFRDAIKSEEVKAVFMKHLGVAETAFPFAALLRDTKGYKIGIHPDWDVKRITCQFYLPTDESLATYGTTIHDNEHNVVRTIPFLPNTGYAFARSDTTYHSVSEIPDIERNSIYLTYNRIPWDEY